MMIRWLEHHQKGVTRGVTDGRTDEWTIHKAAWLQLKMKLASVVFQQVHYILSQKRKLVFSEVLGPHLFPIFENER